MTVDREIAALRRLRGFHLGPAPRAPTGLLQFWSWNAAQRADGSWHIGHGNGLGFCLDDIVSFNGDRFDLYYQGLIEPSNLKRVQSPRPVYTGIFVILRAPIAVEPVELDQVPDVTDRSTHLMVQAWLASSDSR